MIVTVDTASRTLAWGGAVHACEIGRGGACAAEAKREGDGRTPRGDWPVLGALLRPDRGVAPPPRLPWRWLRPDDGWSDDPADPAYNRPVRHPHRWSAERLWRGDGVYDVIVRLGHNSAPPVPGQGSAIFLHLAGERETAGCVAIGRAAMAALLFDLAPGAVLRIV